MSENLLHKCCKCDDIVYIHSSMEEKSKTMKIVCAECADGLKGRYTDKRDMFIEETDDEYNDA